MSDELTIVVRVIPRASKTEIAGMVDGTLRARLAAPPVDGAANAELIKAMAKYFEVTKSDIEILSGQSSRVKRVLVRGLSNERIAKFLNARL